MQVILFTLPAFAGNDITEELNHFLRTVRVLEIQKEFVNSASGQFWVFCVTYLPITGTGAGNAVMPSERREKIDYKNVLSDVEFERFSLLRKIRKQLAEEDAVPPFAVFTDAELAELARNEVLSPSSMRGVAGVGKKKIEKYGYKMCEIVGSIQGNEVYETPGELEGKDS